MALAPLAGYTDSAFRSICKSFGADLLYSEMASVSALAYGSKQTLSLLKFSPSERPYVVQLFGSKPEHFVSAVKIIEQKIKPDGFDINLGCPVKKVLKQGAGAKLMADLDLSREIISRVLATTKLPLSLKVRTQSFSVDLIDFFKNISDLPLAAVMIHGRSLKQLFSGPIDFKIIRASRRYFPGLILANGGIEKFEDIAKLIEKTGADGVGLGRGALGRPWIFSDRCLELEAADRKSLALKTALKHLKLMEKSKGPAGLGEFKGHLAHYLKNFAGASDWRFQAMKADSYHYLKALLSASDVV